MTAPILPAPADDAARGALQDTRWNDAARSTAGLWLLVLLIYLPMMIARHRGTSIAGFALDASTVLVSMLLATPIFLLFRGTIAWAQGVRVVMIGLGIAAAAAGQAGYDLLLVRWMAQHPDAGWPGMAGDLGRGYSGMLNDGTVFAVNAALFQLAFGRRRDRRRERHLAALAAAAERAQLEALRFKLNPHFLFNTLNGISAMIVTSRLAAADEMIDRLSAFLRASFGGDPMAPVTIEREFGVIEQYARIEELRFGDRLAVTLSCTGDAAGRTVPPLLIQALVEHAIEAASRADVPAHIDVVAALQDERLSVTITHPHMEMPEGHLAAACARVSGWPGAEISSRAATTRLRLPRPRGPSGGMT